MKAVRIYDYGHSDQLSSDDIPSPKIKDNEVLVKIHDAGVNPVDWKIREGYMKDMRPVQFPLTIGQDFAGEVIEVGSKILRFKSGDRVFGFAQGAYAEFAAIPEEKIAMMPNSADFIVGASLPTPGLTAYQIVMDVIQPKRGDRILVHGAAGAVGSFVVQIATHLGAEVIANASFKDKEYLTRIGVKQIIDYRTQRFEQLVSDLDAVVDLVGGITAERSYQIVKKGGILVSTVGAVDQAKGENFGIRAQSIIMKPEASGLEKLAKLVDEGVIKPRVDRILPLEQVREAQDLVQAGQTNGKIILEVLQ